MKTPGETSKIKLQHSSIVNQIAERVASEGQSSAVFWAMGFAGRSAQILNSPAGTGLDLDQLGSRRVV